MIRSQARQSRTHEYELYLAVEELAHLGLLEGNPAPARVKTRATSQNSGVKSTSVIRKPNRWAK
jgi:hypothetical protein